MDPSTKAQWKAALNGQTGGFIGCALDSSLPVSVRFEGMAGLIDWQLHGQISSLLARKELPPGKACLLPGDSGLSRPSVVVLHTEPASEPKAFAAQIKKLGIEEIALAESTFPEDFLGKLKQTLKKEGVRCTKVEPESA
jgi:hypothetical protein